MKKTFTFVLLLGILPMLAGAQITGAEMPSIGSQIVYKTLNKNGFDPLPNVTGVGVEWNYKNAFEMSNTVTMDYIDPGTCTEGPSFPGSTVAEAIPPDTLGHFFYELGATEFSRTGFYDGTNKLLLPYANKLKLYEIPFQFGTAFSDAYTCTNGTWDIGGGGIVAAKITNGTYLSDCQGQGKLRVPTGYFDDVYRIYYEEYFTVKADILQDGTFPDIFTIDEYGYEYWKAGHVKPLLTYISTTYTDMGGANSVTVAVRYDKQAVPDGLNVGVDETLAEKSDVSIFPNPSTGLVHINIDSFVSPVSLEIFDMIGNVVYSSNLNRANNNVDLSSLAKGVYSIRVSSDSFVSNQKFILK